LVTLTETIVEEVLVRYGERAKVVLKAAYEVMEEYLASGKKTPGHFDFKGIMRKLSEWGIKYNPSHLLRIMERDYGIIETSYKSVAQKWYVFTDVEAVKKALIDKGVGPRDVIEDPEIYALDIQIAALNIDGLISKVKSIFRRGKLTEVDKEYIREIIFRDVPLIAKVLKDAMRHGDRYREFMIKASYLLRSLKTLSQWSASRKDAFKEPEVILSQARINDSME